MTAPPPGPAVAKTPPPLPPPVLEYSRRLRPKPAARYGVGVALAAACVSGLLAFGLFGGLIELLIVTWPDFGATLLAVPVLLGVLAFATVSVTSFRVAGGQPLVPSPGTPGEA